MQNLGRQQNCAGTSPKHAAALRNKLLDRLVQALFLQKLQLCGALTSGQDQPRATAQVPSRPHLDGLRAQSPQHVRVRRKISLHRQNSNFHNSLQTKICRSQERGIPCPFFFDVPRTQRSTTHASTTYPSDPSVEYPAPAWPHPTPHTPPAPPRHRQNAWWPSPPLLRALPDRWT